MLTYQKIIEQLFSEVDVHINGKRPWDIQVHNEGFYYRVFKDNSLGLGESYMAGWWDCDQINELIRRLLSGNIQKRVRVNLQTLIAYLAAWSFNLQSPSRSKIIAQRHYDLDKELFFSFLDPLRQYSCAYFNGTDDLAQAQENKLDLICRKLNLQQHDRLLDIGCGWGGLARWAAEHYRCQVTALNISSEQIHHARKICRDLPVTIEHRDYREINGNFNKAVSVGMFEHVGFKNYRTFMSVVRRSLSSNGLFLLHTIGSNESSVNGDRWINRYIFPNEMLPSLTQISAAAEGLFVIEDMHNLCAHYHRTLLAWNERFQRAWPKLAKKYDEQFKRMWEFYLLSCAGCFAARYIQVWQIVMSKGGTQHPHDRFS